ncbi:MAG: replication initiation protein [Alphaproteobacteria bacterium]|nr:replication initiation protein [Alphaproteobacteria bacterium]
MTRRAEPYHQPRQDHGRAQHAGWQRIAPGGSGCLCRFRELLGVPPGSYDRADNFMRNVIARALLEVNGLSDIGIQIEMERKHPRAPAHAEASRGGTNKATNSGRR